MHLEDLGKISGRRVAVIDESRFQRLEDKVDDVREDVGELRSDMKLYMRHIEDHIAGDKKVIDKLVPVLDKLPQIVEVAEQHQFEKKMKKKATKALAVVATVAGIAVSISRLL